jgi:crossover junction endodeoxyribonuclease RuvC
VISVGIDPGKSGAIAVVRDGEFEPVGLFPMPIVRSAQGRDEYDLASLRQLLKLRCFPGFADPGWRVSVVVERGQALPRSMGGAAANFQRGYGRGLLEGLLSGLLIPYTLVAPQVWQRAMLAGTSGVDTKQRSIIAAQRLFPGVDLRRTSKCRTLDDGLADALLLAAYARRLGQVPAA